VIFAFCLYYLLNNIIAITDLFRPCFRHEICLIELSNITEVSMVANIIAKKTPNYINNFTDMIDVARTHM
jgi:hypothetical protein